MNQDPGFDSVEAGRRLGHDLYRHSRLPAQADWPGAVHEGFQAAAARRLPRSSGDRFQRKWLQLRLGALARQRVVAADVTPDLLQRMDIDQCPVTREPLTHATQLDSDASIDRLNNDGAYTGGNLAVLSVKANRAKGSLGFEAVLARARSEVTDLALTPAQWMRLAVLMQGPAFATRQHLAPVLPLCAPLPVCSVRLALQQVQRLFTLQAVRPAGRNALVHALGKAATGERPALALRRLGEQVHAGLKRLHAEELCWDVWLQEPVMAALQTWRKSLDDVSWARTAATAGWLAGGRRVSTGSLAAWHLQTLGRYPSQPPTPCLASVPTNRPNHQSLAD